MHPKVKKTLHLFFGKFEPKSFITGETIIKPGKNQGVFFLTRGAVKMFSSSKERGELTLNIYRAYALFPMSLVFGKLDKYTYSALTEVQGYFAPKKDFEHFIKKNPDVIFDLLKRIYQGLDGFFISLEALMLGDAFYRVLTHLIIYTRRFGQNNQNIIAFDWHLTHHQLASQTGLARESVTRQIEKLKKKGLVGYSGKKLVIYDFPKLEEECFSYFKQDL